MVFSICSHIKTWNHVRQDKSYYVSLNLSDCLRKKKNSANDILLFGILRKEHSLDQFQEIKILLCVKYSNIWLHQQITIKDTCSSVCDYFTGNNAFITVKGTNNCFYWAAMATNVFLYLHTAFHSAFVYTNFSFVFDLLC